MRVICYAITGRGGGEGREGKRRKKDVSVNGFVVRAVYRVYTGVRTEKKKKESDGDGKRWREKNGKKKRFGYTTKRRYERTRTNKRIIKTSIVRINSLPASEFVGINRNLTVITVVVDIRVETLPRRGNKTRSTTVKNRYQNTCE